MAQFSIRETLNFSLSAYARHIVLLLCGSVMLAGSLWLAHMAPRMVAEKLGAHVQIDMDMSQAPAEEQTEQAAEILQKVQRVTALISGHLQAAPKHALAIAFLVWLCCWALYLFLLVGFMKLCLVLKDKDSASINLMVSASTRQVLRFVGAFALYFLYAFCVVIGISVLTIPLGMLLKGILGGMVTGILGITLWVVLLIASFCWLVGYAFFGFCIVDKANVGVRDAFRMSKEITRGSRWHLLGAFVAASMVSFIVMLIVTKIAGIVSPDMAEPAMENPSAIAHAFMQFGHMSVEKRTAVQAIVTALTSPFWVLYAASLYRSLQRGNK